MNAKSFELMKVNDKSSIRPREEIQRESPVKQLRERNRVERKETIRNA